MEDFKPLIQDLMNDLTIAVKAVIVAKAPSLKGSDLVDSIEFRPLPVGFELWANNYYDYVDKGRRARVTKVPIAALVNWISKKRIKGRNAKGRFITNNQLAFAIQTSIFKQGIKGKLFDVYVDQTIDEVTDVILDQQALDTVTLELDIQFDS